MRRQSTLDDWFMSVIEVKGCCGSPRIIGGTILQRRGCQQRNRREGSQFHPHVVTEKDGFCALTKSQTAFSAKL